MHFNVRFASRPVDLEAAFAIRRHVFEVEQGIPRPMLPDVWDGVADHALALDPEGHCVGTARAYRLDSRTFRIGRQVVAPEARNLGVGTKILEALERMATLRGVKEVVVHAQLSAEEYYQKQGYRPEGGIFDEKGTPRRLLRKTLLP
jgi:predicted GNAT family N-acyltransferase